MKRFFLLICLCSIILVVFAQKPMITGTHLLFEKVLLKDTVSVIIFDTITSATKIEYNGTYVKWYKFTDKTTPISTFNYIFQPDDSTGYIIDVDGKFDTIYVIDYKKHRPVFNAFIAENNPGIQCEDLKLLLNSNVPKLNYETPDLVSHNLPRNFTVEYKTLKWTTKWEDSIATTLPFTLPATEIIVTAPLRDTYFTISGDQYAKELGLPAYTFTSPLYSAVAVKCHITTEVTSRKHLKNNEAEAPSDATPISFSAPYDVQFISNANEPVALYYKWEIFKNKQLIISRTDKDHRYTFDVAGTYTAKVTTSNKYCTYSDSVKIIVSESVLYVPNVFTPNGDGYNDEFRVAYKSLISFEAWVYNRWGRLVYHWTDPTKGWDGNINGRKASPGPYFYVIKALGSDFNPNSDPVGKTKLRVGEYLKKGDINLLRGIQK